MALDLTGVDPSDGEPWDFTKKDKRLKAMELVKKHKPGIILLGPPCSVFSVAMFWNYVKMSEDDARRKIEEGVGHLHFALLLCAIQYREGRHFALEHPVGAQSWKLDSVKLMAKLPGVQVVNFDFCMLGMKATDRDGQGRVKKRTTIMTTCDELARALREAQCDGHHRHVRLVDGGVRASQCQVYPE